MPKLRFPEFTDEHTKVTIGDIYSERSERCTEEMELLSVTINDGVKRRSEVEGKDNSSDDKSNYKVVHIGDMVYNSMRMWQGASGISQYNGIVSPAYTVLQPQISISNNYFAALFKTKKLIDAFQKNSQGLTSDTWNLKYPQIAPIKICIPTLIEQNKIAKILDILSKRIEKQKELISFFKSYKRGLSNTIFGKKTLIINSAVKVIPLGLYCKITMGQSPDSNTYNSDHIGLPLVQGNADMKNGFTNPTKYTSMPTKTCNEGSIILSVRAPVGSVGMANQTVCLGRGVCAINAPYNEYVYQYLKYCEPKWKTIEQGGTFTAINGDDIKNFPLILPNEKDMNYIVSVLRNIDNLITRYELELENLSRYKQSLLQNLFI